VYVRAAATKKAGEKTSQAVFFVERDHIVAVDRTHPEQGAILAEVARFVLLRPWERLGG
jgi:hypothetical protein